MWMLSDDERVVTQAEWYCLKLGLSWLHEYIEADDLDMALTGVAIFDQLTSTQKLAILAETCEALKDPNMPAPTLNAVNEGTIAALLQSFWNQLVIELDMSFDDEFPILECRRALLRAFDEDDDPEAIEMLPNEDELELEPWDDLFSLFESRFLDDNDYEMAALLDLPAEQSEGIKTIMGIDDEYFVSVPPDPSERQMNKVQQKLAKLLGLPSPDDDGRFPAISDRFTGLTVGPCTAQEIADWSKNPWITIASLDYPIWDCDFDVWRSNFSSKVLAADPDDAIETEQLRAQRAQRREAALQSLGAWPEF